ncbi:ankyrin repeat-containing domain protein, partial [Pyronema omphalodes]
VSRTDDHGNTELHNAVQKEDPELVKYLLLDIADVNKINNAGFTSLHLAAQNRNFSICSILLGNGADVNHKFPVNGDTVLQFAVCFLPTLFLELFLQHKSEIDIENEEGNTALTLAVLSNDTEETKLLLDDGADPDRKNK